MTLLLLFVHNRVYTTACTQPRVHNRVYTTACTHTIHHEHLFTTVSLFPVCGVVANCEMNVAAGCSLSKYETKSRTYQGNVKMYQDVSDFGVVGGRGGGLGVVLGWWPRGDGVEGW